MSFCSINIVKFLAAQQLVMWLSVHSLTVICIFQGRRYIWYSIHIQLLHRNRRNKELFCSVIIIHAILEIRNKVSWSKHRSNNKILLAYTKYNTLHYCFEKQPAFFFGDTHESDNNGNNIKANMQNEDHEM